MGINVHACLTRLLLGCTYMLLLLSQKGVLLDGNKYYHTSTLCLPESNQAMYKKVDGAVITSKNEDNLECVVTFQTDSILQQFMLRFEHLALDCNDHLFIFDGARTYGKFEYDLSCRSTLTDVGTIFIKSNYVTLKYTTDKWSQAGNGFKLVVTAVKKPNAGCQNFQCMNEFCISQDLACDGVNHCSDNSDETSYAFCKDDDATKQILGLTYNIFLSVVIGIFIICCAFFICVIFCFCRKEVQQGQFEAAAQIGMPHTVIVGQTPYPSLYPYSRIYYPHRTTWPHSAIDISERSTQKHYLLPKTKSCNDERKHPSSSKQEWLV